MTSSLRHRLRQLLPPTSWCWTLVTLWFAFILVEWLLVASLKWYFGFWPDEPRQFLAANCLLGVGLVLIACWRAINLNPVLNQNYRAWLQLTPWTPAKPLPLGPVLLTTLDALVIGMFLLAWTGESHRLYLTLAFFLPYCCLLTCSNFLARSYAAVYVSIGIASLLLLVSESPWLVLAVSLACYASCDWGFRHSLQAFPWTTGLKSILSSPTNPFVYGHWPMVNQLSLKGTKASIPWQHVWSISLLATWLAGELTYLALLNASVREQKDAPSTIMLLLFAFSVYALAHRAGHYLSSKRSPLGFFARIASGRIIIPGFDKSLVALLVILVTGCVLPALLIYLGFPLYLVMAICVFAVSFSALGCGPSLAEWNLTGEYRMQFGKSGSSWKQL